MSNTAGYVLLISSAVPATFGWNLSRQGLSQVKAASDQAAQAASETKDVIKEAHTAIAAAPPGEKANLAATKASDVVEKTDDLTTGINAVNDALGQMTGVFAPARVFLALAFLLILAALVGLDVITVVTG